MPHGLIINPRSAKTHCGMRVVAYYPMRNTALGNQGKTFECTVEFDKVTCLGCLESNKAYLKRKAKNGTE